MKTLKLFLTIIAIGLAILTIFNIVMFNSYEFGN